MRFIGGLLLCLLFNAVTARAETAPKLRVGIFERTPFAMKDANGKWTGLAVDVWEQVSGMSGLAYEYVETPPEKIFDRAARGELDIVVGELGVSVERERIIDFAQPYLTCPVSVAMKRRHLFPNWRELFHELAADGIFTMLIVLFASLLVFATALWIIERRVDRTHFGGRPLNGFGSALWFAAVTMTTVGYGDKTPQSAAGRMVVFFWMFFGVIIVSVFTGTVASGITLARSEAMITRASDLNHFRNGVLNGSSVQNLLAGAGVRAQKCETVDDGLRAVETDTITAFVSGELSLRYSVNVDFPGKMLVLPLATSHVSYAFAMRPDFPLALRESINESLIDLTNSPGWEALVERWTGPPARR